MDWTLWLIAGGVILGFWILKRSGQISAELARRHLKEGAVVIDVRSAAEFGEGHLPDALNVPLGELADAMPRRVPDKNAVVLLHCLSGGRSAIAKSRLKALGYRQVFNLGSYSRAKAIVAQARLG